MAGGISPVKTYRTMARALGVCAVCAAILSCSRAPEEQAEPPPEVARETNAGMS